jgi:oligopeptide transport system substrate-binding protein
MIYSGLVTLAGGLTVIPDDARKWDLSQDGKTYTFHLLPNLKFSDGTPLRASDFAYSINRALDPNLNAAAAYYLCALAGAAAFNPSACGNGGSSTVKTLIGSSILAPDDQTLELKLAQPAAYFLEALTYPSSYPVEQSLVQKYPNGSWTLHLDTGGCSGPFKVESYSVTVGKYKAVSYVPNPFWESAHNQQLTIQRVVRPFVLVQDDEYNAYRSGSFDYTDVPGQDYAYARGQVDFHEVASLSLQYFGLNFRLPPFDNQAVRQAFDLALNKQYLVDRVLDGGGIPTNHIVPQGMPGFNPSLTNPPPDQSQSLTGNQADALSLLKQAQQACHGPDALGSDGKPSDPDWCPYIDTAHYASSLKPIIFYAPNNKLTRVALAQAAVEQWSSDFGLSNIQEQTIPGSFITFYNNVQAGDYDAFALGWSADYPDPQDWLSLQFASNAQNNNSKVNDPSLDALMAKADANPDTVTRMQQYNQAEQQAIDLVPWIPYEQEKVIWRVRPWVHGFGLNGVQSFPDLDWPQVFIAQH